MAIKPSIGSRNNLVDRLQPVEINTTALTLRPGALKSPKLTVLTSPAQAMDWGTVPESKSCITVNLARPDHPTLFVLTRHYPPATSQRLGGLRDANTIRARTCICVSLFGHRLY